MLTDKELEPTKKSGLATETEQTKEGVVFQPAVDIFETENGITLLADMPGVKADQLNVDLHDDILTIRGGVTSPESGSEIEVMSEFNWGSYYRKFSLADTIDQNKIAAKLTDGVLRLELPKVEKAKPRKITVKTD